MKKKLLSLLLVGAMAASLLVGCGGDSKDSSKDYSSEIDMEEDPYTVAIQVVVLPGTDYSAIESKMEDALSEIALKKVNAKVDVQFVSIAELNNKTQLAVASDGEDKIDIVAASTVMKVETLVGKDILIDMNEGGLLEKRGAGLVSLFGDAIKVGSIEGKQLAVPANTYYALETGIYYNKTMADKYGITLPEKGTFAQLEEALYKLHAADSSVKCHYPGGGNLLYIPFFYGTENFGDNAKYGAIMSVDSTEIVNLYETEEFKDYCLSMLKWKKDGLILQEDNSDETPSQTYIADGSLFYTPASLNPIQRADYIGNGMASNIEIGFMVINDATITSSSVDEYMWGIASSCERPDKAMDVLNLLYSDAEFANILKYGFEGENYEKTGDSTIAMNYSYFPMFYKGGDVATMYNTIGEDFIPQMEALESSATKSAAYGYLFLDEDYQTEAAAVTSVIEKYLARLQTGLFADEAEMTAYLDEFNAELKKAGIENIIEGNQEQFDAFLGK